jgi:hypothetical protein
VQVQLLQYQCQVAQQVFHWEYQLVLLGQLEQLGQLVLLELLELLALKVQLVLKVLKGLLVQMVI